MSNPTPHPKNESMPPTMRVAVELTFVRNCVECRGVAERTAIAAIHDASVTGMRLIPGAKHAHAVTAESGVLQHLASDTGASTDAPDGQNHLFEATPRSDTNGFDPQERG